MPWDQVKAFGEIVLNTVGITANAEAISAFGTAMASMPEAVEGKRDCGISGGIVEAY